MTETNVLNQEQDTTVNDDSEDLFTTNDPTEEDDEDLFGDWTPEGDDKPASDDGKNQNVDDKKDVEVNQEVTDSQVAGSQDQPTFMTIKYNKEAINLTKDEAITLAQKGKNYDEIHNRYENLKENEPTLNELSKLAQRFGMNSIDYVKSLSEAQEKAELDNEIEALRNQYPNSDDALLTELAKVHLQTKQNVVSKKQEEETNARKQEIGRQLDLFKERYPDVDPSKLDKRVYELMKNNYTLIEAYLAVNDEIRKEEDSKRESLELIKQQNEENKRKSLGNLSNSGYETKDDFVDELFSD